MVVAKLRLPRILTLIIWSILLGALTLSQIQAQPNITWRQSVLLGGTGSFLRSTDMVVDQSANVYVAGTIHFGDFVSQDWVTIKYNSVGNEQWLIIYNGSGNGQDQPTSITTNSFGDVYVTGFSKDSTTGFDYTTIKYSPEGEQLWITIYDGPASGGDKASDIFVDANNDVYITGTSAGSGTFGDFATVKYNSEGIEQWVARYNGTADSTDNAIAIEVDSFGNVFVAGISYDNGTMNDYVVVKYNSDGIEQWVVRYNGPANSADILKALFLDDASNVYVTGSSKDLNNMQDFATVKYNSDGIEQWVARFNGPSGLNDLARALIVGSSKDVYVVGSSFSNDTNFDYATVKYNSNGEIQWIAKHNGSAYPKDIAVDIAIDKLNFIYVTGFSSDIHGFESRMETIKYNSNGEKIWLSEEMFSTRNWAETIEVDDLSNIYISYTIEGNTWSAIATLKYNQNIVSVKNEGLNPEKYSLSQNHPNPFNPVTTIEYSLPKSSEVSLIIYNIVGQEVARLVQGVQKARNHAVNWDASNLSSGVYIYRLTAGDFVQTKKMLLLK